MDSLDSAIDTRLTDLQFKWRNAFEASIAARADYQLLSRDPASSADQLDGARECLGQRCSVSG